MGLTDVLCDYIYSRFQKLKKAIEKNEKIGKYIIREFKKKKKRPLYLVNEYNGIREENEI